MKDIDHLTIKQVRVPTGRTITEVELEDAERALQTLLYNYTEEILKPELRIKLRKEFEVSSDYAFLMDYDLMKPAELYQLINAAQLLGKYLFKRNYHRIELKATKGDPEAIQDLEFLK